MGSQGLGWSCRLLPLGARDLSLKHLSRSVIGSRLLLWGTMNFGVALFFSVDDPQSTLLAEGCFLAILPAPGGEKLFVPGGGYGWVLQHPPRSNILKPVRWPLLLLMG
jgi:hypothetical protein